MPAPARNGREHAILTLLRQRGPLPRREIARLAGLSESRTAAYLALLREEGEVAVSGGRWRLAAGDGEEEASP